MSNKKILKQHTGGAIDEALSEQALACIAEHSDDVELPLAIGRLVGRYRDTAAGVAPALAKSIKHAEAVQNTISKLSADIELMPEDIRGMATDGLRRISGEYYQQFTDRVLMDLLRYQRALAPVIEELKGLPEDRNRSRKQLEHELLRNVGALLTAALPGEKVIDIAGATLKILTCAEIPDLPKSREEASKIINGY